MHRELFMMTHEKLTPVVIFYDAVFEWAVYSEKLKWPSIGQLALERL